MRTFCLALAVIFITESARAADYQFDIRVVEVVDAMDFNLEFSSDRTHCQPGESIGVRPMLTTADGLVLNSCSYDQNTDSRFSNCAAKIELRGSSGAILSARSSGFA